MTKNNISNKLHTIAIDDNNYQTLRRLGSVGDSFNDVVTSVLNTAKRKKAEERQDDNQEARKSCGMPDKGSSIS